MRMHTALSLLIALSALSDGPAASASLSIKILSAAFEPLPGVSVVVTRPESWQARTTTYRSVTGVTGVATFEVEANGVYDVTACLTGFVPTRLLQVPAGGSYHVLLNIDPTPPDEHMISSPDAPFKPFNPCAVSGAAARAK